MFRRKIKLKKRYWLLAGLVLLVVIIVLMIIEPGGYRRPQRIDEALISPYLTHKLLPQIYNGAQRREPFEFLVVEEGLNDIMARSDWLLKASKAGFSSPQVSFVPGRIVLMAATEVKGVEVIVTIVVKPKIDEQGLLNLFVSKVKIGAVNVTVFARAIAKRKYAEKLEALGADKDDIKVQALTSLLYREPFVPIFNIGSKKLRVRRVTVVPKMLTAELVPAGQ